jgi:hypothetical protein
MRCIGMHIAYYEKTPSNEAELLGAKSRKIANIN